MIIEMAVAASAFLFGFVVGVRATKNKLKTEGLKHD
jgi:hypothetical protein